MTNILNSMSILVLAITIIWHLVGDHGKGGWGGKPATAF